MDITVSMDLAELKVASTGTMTVLQAARHDRPTFPLGRKEEDAVDHQAGESSEGECIVPFGV